MRQSIYNNSYNQPTFDVAVLALLSDAADPFRDPPPLPGRALGDATLAGVGASLLPPLVGREVAGDEALVGVDVLSDAEPKW